MTVYKIVGIDNVPLPAEIFKPRLVERMFKAYCGSKLIFYVYANNPKKVDHIHFNHELCKVDCGHCARMAVSGTHFISQGKMLDREKQA